MHLSEWKILAYTLAYTLALHHDMITTGYIMYAKKKVANSIECDIISVKVHVRVEKFFWYCIYSSNVSFGALGGYIFYWA